MDTRRSRHLAQGGESADVTIPRDVLAAASIKPGDAVTVSARAGHVEITPATTSAQADALEAGRTFIQRYPRTLRDLAR
jgi:antitoxin component of MazEF toxin-antitoxin module